MTTALNTPTEQKKEQNVRRSQREKRREEGRMAYSQIGDRVEGPSRCLIGADSLFQTELDSSPLRDCELDTREGEML